MGKTHNFFDSVRGLALENQGKDDLFRSVLVLAENVAKVTYNAYGYEAPFDHHAGWLIGAGFLDIVERVNDSEFTARAWSILSSEQYITLTIPEMCNPACSFCNIWYLGSR
jgi:hypothetical protein